MEVRALSIAGPYAYWLADGRVIEPFGTKAIEVRSWHTKHENILVLLHISQSTDYDSAFRQMDFGLEEAPKSSIVGAAILKKSIRYDSEALFEQDRRTHCWTGDDTYETIVRECYEGKPPYGHIFTNPVVFKEPIRNVPGNHRYWQPNPGNARQYEVQQPAFLLATEQAQELMKLQIDVCIFGALGKNSLLETNLAPIYSAASASPTEAAYCWEGQTGEPGVEPT